MIEKTKLPLAAFVADNATVRGHVTAGKGSSIYFGFRRSRGKMA